MAAQADTDVYLEKLEEAAYTGKEPNQMWDAPVLGADMGPIQQGILANGGK